MSLGIGILCSEPRSGGHGPDAVVLMAESPKLNRIHTGTEGQKIFIYPRERLSCVCVGRSERGSELVSLIQNELGNLKTKSHQTVMEAVSKAAYAHRAQHFRFDILPRYYYSSPEISSDQHRDINDAWQRYDIGAHLVVTTFDDDGRALMYLVARTDDARWVHHCAFPGISAIGLGAHAAHYWLNYRQQRWACSVIQSAYHAYEALRVATSSSSSIGCEVLIATRGKMFQLTDSTPEVSECPISLKGLEDMFSRYGPQSTEDLGRPLRPARMSKKPVRPKPLVG